MTLMKIHFKGVMAVYEFSNSKSNQKYIIPGEEITLI